MTQQQIGFITMGGGILLTILGLVFMLKVAPVQAVVTAVGVVMTLVGNMIRKNDIPVKE